ncbi:hypothetical protein DFH06DRAFT_1138592 [Mycena polygramma]|nr:hypothetical protein DFH06DRAFT_1138592 [Mycena polygramma]
MRAVPRNSFFEIQHILPTKLASVTYIPSLKFPVIKIAFNLRSSSIHVSVSIFELGSKFNALPKIALVCLNFSMLIFWPRPSRPPLCPFHRTLVCAGRIHPTIVKHTQASRVNKDHAISRNLGLLEGYRKCLEFDLEHPPLLNLYTLIGAYDTILFFPRHPVRIRPQDRLLELYVDAPYSLPKGRSPNCAVLEETLYMKVVNRHRILRSARRSSPRLEHEGAGVMYAIPGFDSRLIQWIDASESQR